MSGAKGFFLCLGLDPHASRQTEFRFAQRQVDHLKRFGPEYKYYELFSACMVLAEPLAIFEDLKRAGQAKGLCYVGKPRCFRDGVEHPPHPDMVFVVYCTEDRKVFEWGWESEDDAAPGCPKNVKQRFGKCLKRHSSIT